MKLSHLAVLQQLASTPWTADGDIISKQDRDELITMGLAERLPGKCENGRDVGTGLTAKGREMARFMRMYSEFPGE